MSTVVQATCPGCKNVLRIPADWLHQSVRCKHCGLVLQAQQAGNATAPPVIPARTPPPAPGKVPSATARPTAPPPAPRVLPAPPPVPRPVAEPVVPVAQPVALAAPVVPAASADPGRMFDLQAQEAGSPPRRPRRRKRGSWVGLIVFLALLGAGGVVVALTWSKINALFAPAPLPRDKDVAEDDPPRPRPRTTRKGDPKPEEEPVETVSVPKGRAPFPRRALVISAHNYLYANPTQPGFPVPNTARNVSRFVDRLSRGLQIPPNQVAHLSDAAGKNQARPPIKPVIEQTLTAFLDGSRAQDRILVFFIGHAVEVGDDAYLVPLEGELDNAKTLIPLKWVYEQLQKCKARQ
jgi:hypothetical protein